MYVTTLTAIQTFNFFLSKTTDLVGFIYLLHEHSSPTAFLAFCLNLLLFWPYSVFAGESQPSKGYKHP